MAISKILYIGDCGNRYHGKHLKQALCYITAREKTGGGRWIGSLNCQPEQVYEQMRQTKEQFEKSDKRQGYHLIISFTEGEIDAETAFEVIGKFAKEYLGADYETLYAVHNNTQHVHGHLIFNSVSFRDGRKYRYKKGDWAKEIQPITNRLCEEYGLSTIEITEDRARSSENYKEWNDFRDGKFIWSDMIKRDLDTAVLQADTYDEFLDILKTMGYGTKNTTREEGKYLSIKPMGLTRFCRCKSLGEDYSEERIKERILEEKPSASRLKNEQKTARIVTCKIKRYRRVKLSGIQKKYFSKLYQTGLLKNRPYSQIWKYRDDIRRMGRLQEEYLFLSRHDITDLSNVFAVTDRMAEKKKELLRKKSRIFKERARLKPLFNVAEELEGLQECENCYQRGELLFESEHVNFQKLAEKLRKEGYSMEQLSVLKEHYRSEISFIREQEKAVCKEDRIAKRIIKEMLSETTAILEDRVEKQERITGQEKQMDKEEEKSKDRQPR